MTSTSSGGKVPSSRSGGTGGSHIHLWQFLKELLSSPQLHGSCIRWLDRSKGVFKIEDSVRVARLWGKRKNRPAMNYDKLSRSIRQYYKKGIMKKTERSQRLVYQFCHPYCLQGGMISHEFVSVSTLQLGVNGDIFMGFYLCSHSSRSTIVVHTVCIQMRYSCS